jgi:hypothetical protein
MTVRLDDVSARSTRAGSLQRRGDGPTRSQAGWLHAYARRRGRRRRRRRRPAATLVGAMPRIRTAPGMRAPRSAHGERPLAGARRQDNDAGRRAAAERLAVLEGYVGEVDATVVTLSRRRRRDRRQGALRGSVPLRRKPHERAWPRPQSAPPRLQRGRPSSGWRRFERRRRRGRHGDRLRSGGSICMPSAFRHRMKPTYGSVPYTGTV